MDLREKRVDLILQQLEDLPTLPAVAVRVLEATGHQSSSAKQVVQLIESDPSLTARILQMVHRADSGVRKDVQSVDRAVVLLGFDAVRSAVLAISVFETFGAMEESDNSHFNREAFWRHCVAVACCAELLAESKGSRLSGSDAFLCGLLHDIGKIALDATLPKSFGRVVEAADLLRGNIADIERNVIGLDHMVVGKRLAEKWHLPTLLRDCIWLHGQDPRALPTTVANARMIDLITLADQLVRELHLGYSGNYSFNLSREALIEAVGLTPTHVEAALKQLVDRIEPRAQWLGLGVTTTTELYQQALAQANKDLGRVSAQLASKNRKLSARTHFFEALSRFQSEIRPDASPQMVLQAIAQTAVTILGTTCVAAFSLPPGQSYAETLLCDADGKIFETSLVDLWPVRGTGDSDDESPRRVRTDQPATNSRPTATNEDLRVAVGPKVHSSSIHTSAPPLPRPGDGPVLVAGEELEWFVQMISPRLPYAQRFWICLEADGHCAGGVVWGGEPGESHRLGPQAQELTTVASGWALALRTAQIREEARSLAEHLAETNRQLQTAQSEILRSRTMITVGEMAAGAAHEMNNPLAVISGRSQLLAQQLSEPKLKAAANLVHEQADRLSAIITELMDFAKPAPPVIRQVDIAEVIDRALHEAKTGNDPADRKIELTIADVPLITVDARQVSAAMMEVIENSIHATDPKGGRIHLHAGYDTYSSRVVVTVTDNGCGMDENTVKRAFDPFFSAKPAGRRRGLGLAKALRWIEASGGSIRMESRPGKGTRTVILLPSGSASGTGSLPMSDGAKTRAI